MILLGITGSIGMGKSTVAGLFRQEGIPVLCSDDVVHQLLSPGGQAEQLVLAIFPKARSSAGSIDRQALGKTVFHSDAAMAQLEAILHPLVRQKQQRYIAHHRRHNAGIIGFDIPLLFETGADGWLDAVVVATAPAFVQRLRVLQRRGMTEDKFAAILRRQMPDTEKRRYADFIVHTGQGKGYSKRQVKHIIQKLRAKTDREKWPVR